MYPFEGLVKHTERAQALERLRIRVVLLGVWYECLSESSHALVKCAHEL